MPPEYVRGGTVGRVGQPEAHEQLVGPGGHRGAGQVREPADQPEVLAPGQVLVDRGVLTGEADAGPDGVGLAGDVEAEHLGPPAVAVDDGREDADGGGLPRAVGAEEAEHGAGRDLEVDAGERHDVAEALGEALDADRRGLDVGVGVVSHARHRAGILEGCQLSNRFDILTV